MAGRVLFEAGQKRVRAMFGGWYVADTTRPVLVWEKPCYPTYYFPAGDVRTDLLVSTGDTAHSPIRGDSVILSVQVGERWAEGAVAHLAVSPIAELVDTYRFDWAAMDHWFEEDEEVFVHARDPYKRVDVLRSSRHVRIEVAGTTVADSHIPTLLFETGLPVRCYLPKTDVAMHLLTPTDRVTQCSYKGIARYWTVVVDGTEYGDVVWGYDTPVRESIPIAGLVCFYDERVDVFVDGELQERPHTIFS